MEHTMKRTPLSRRTPLRATSTLQPGQSRLARTGSLRPVSSKRAREKRTYDECRREVWNRQDGKCKVALMWLDLIERAPSLHSFYRDLSPEYFDCDLRMTDVHHMKGRVGDLYTDTRWMVGLCRPCHDYVELNPEWAREVGLSASRHGGAA